MRCQSVLIVEDERDIRDTLEEVLKYEGFSVHSSSNGQEALTLLKTIERPCLILLDMMMPVMNGWEFLQMQRQDEILATIPVVVVSAGGEKAQAPGAIHF